MPNIPESMTLQAMQVMTDEGKYQFKAEELPAALAFAGRSFIREIRFFVQDQDGRSFFLSLYGDPESDPRQWKLAADPMAVAGEVTLPSYQDRRRERFSFPTENVDEGQ